MASWPCLAFDWRTAEEAKKRGPSLGVCSMNERDIPDRYTERRKEKVMSPSALAGAHAAYQAAAHGNSCK